MRSFIDARSKTDAVLMRICETNGNTLIFRRLRKTIETTEGRKQEEEGKEWRKEERKKQKNEEMQEGRKMES